MVNQSALEIVLQTTESLFCKKCLAIAKKTAADYGHGTGTMFSQIL